MSAPGNTPKWNQWPDRLWPANLATEVLETLLERLDAATAVIEDLPIETQVRRSRQLLDAAKAVRAELRLRHARRALHEAIVALRRTGGLGERGDR